MKTFHSGFSFDNEITTVSTMNDEWILQFSTLDMLEAYANRMETTGPDFTKSGNKFQNN